MQIRLIFSGTALLAVIFGVLSWVVSQLEQPDLNTLKKQKVDVYPMAQGAPASINRDYPLIEDQTMFSLAALQKAELAAGEDEFQEANIKSGGEIAAVSTEHKNLNLGQKENGPKFGQNLSITQTSEKILDEFLASAATELALAKQASMANKDDESKDVARRDSPLEGSAEDDLIFYDYSDGANPSPPSKGQNKIVVPRTPATATPLPKKQKTAAARVTPVKPGPAKKEMTSPQTVGKVAPAAGQSSTLALKIAEIKWGNGLQSIRDFEFVPDDDSGDRFDDYGRGQIEFQHQLNNVGVRRGVILKRGYTPTSVNLIFESGQVVYEVPLASYDLWASLQEKYHFFEKAGLLIDLDENIDEVTLDAPFAQALYLDEDFQITTSHKAYRYVWFVGVRPGNVQISYRTFDNQETAQTLLLKSDENHFLVNELQKGRGQQVLFTQRHLLSSTPQELDLATGDISYFNFDLKLEKIGLNALKYQRPSLPLGAREYFLINYLPDTMAGTQNQKLELPGKEFQEQIYRDLELRPNDGRCVAQINLPKKIFLLNAAAANGEGTLPINIAYLDRDGVMRTESSEQSQYALLTSEGLGSINVKVIYFDGSVDFLQTFCVPNTYFVEQL
ncbi:MAG: hypothetical protein J6Y94_08725 [Bacteriovoracaceae bacterium]|nr:hypothetical protein [Bacteriovoracaceae bacterium]